MRSSTPRARPTPWCAGVALALALAGSLLAASGDPSPAAAREEPPPAADLPTTVPPLGDRGIIPAPDAGVPPRDVGDRGGAAQLALLGLITAGVALMVALAVRESRRARSP